MGNFWSSSFDLESQLRESEERMRREFRLSEEATRVELVKEEATRVELVKEVESLRSINRRLEERLAETTEIGLGDSDTRVPLGEVSKEKISQIVEKYIRSEANIKYIPDAVERQLYRNIFTIIIGVLNELITESSIDLLGHQVTFNMHAKVAEEQT